jgi:ABC-type microcin C transport system duplicated ATPase subunit YejF
MVFQEPMSPELVYTVGDQVVEVVRVHRDVSRRGCREPRD